MELTVMEQLQFDLVKENRLSSEDSLSTFKRLPIETFAQLKDSDLLPFLQTILSKEHMTLFEQVLELLPKIPYSQSYTRRSYRAPHCIKLHSERIIKLIFCLKKQRPYDFYEVFKHNGKMVYQNDIRYFISDEQKPIVSTEVFSYEVALKLNAKEPQLEELVREILWKNGAHPLYGKELISGIMMSEHEEMHALLANVLIAAKNQEGVRQVITESIDEGSLKAQLAFMKVILEHDLLRFSSVVRAVDVWFGLGYDVSNSRQLKHVLQTSYEALRDEELTKTLLASKSNLDVFIALWCIGSQDINGILNRLDTLLAKEDYMQQTVLYTLENMEIKGSASHLVFPHLLQTNNLVTFLYGLPLVVKNFPFRFGPKSVSYFFETQPWLTEHAEQWLEKLEQFITEFPGDTYKVEGIPFPFLTATYSKQRLFVLQLMLAAYTKKESYLDNLAAMIPNMSVECRQFFYSFVPSYTKNYELLLVALKDRSQPIRLDALAKLTSVQYPLAKMKAFIPYLLSLKSGAMRLAVMKFLKKQPIDEIEAFAQELLQDKKQMVRLGILEILVDLKDQLTVKDWASYMQSPTDKELSFLCQFESETLSQSEQEVLTPLLQYKQKEEALLTGRMRSVQYGLQPETDIFFTFHDLIHYDFDRLKKKLEPLRALIESYATFEYIPDSYYKKEQTQIGERLWREANKAQFEGSIDQLPLAEIWVDWLIKSELTIRDICCYLYVKQVEVTEKYESRKPPKEAIELLDEYIPAEKQHITDIFKDELFEEQVSRIIHYTINDGEATLQKILCEHFKQLENEYILLCSSMLRDFANQGYTKRFKVKYRGKDYTAINIRLFNMALYVMGRYAQSEQQVVQFFYTVKQLLLCTEEYFEYLSFEGIMIAFQRGMLTEDHMHRILLTPNFKLILEKGQEVINEYGQEVQAVIDSLKALIVEGELVRGEAKTELTKMVRHLKYVSGIDYFIRILQALDNEKLIRQWMYEPQIRKESLCSLLLKAVPSPQESKEQCFAKLDAAGLSETRLIEAMVYNPQFIELISEYIGWDGLASAAWYFIAHTSEQATDFEAAKIQTYSAIPIADFQRGAFDRDWFVDARARMTKEQFDKVYNAAKYATLGSNHRRAQLYVQATLGELDAEQLKAEIVAKRNKDKLRAFGLLPATMDEAKERYLFFQQFLKESRAFGAQRRASEAEAVEMAITNLAQQVASGNTTQFMWQMEQERYRELEGYFKPIELEEVTMRLVRMEQKVELEIIKQGKALKSVPKKLAKHEDVLKMQEAKKELTEQYRRTRQQLEVSMCEEVLFDAQIVYSLLENQLLAGLLSQLIWRQDDQYFAILDKKFITCKHEEIHIVGDIQIAHPAHFYAAGNWRDWQHFVFEHGYQQPFKQVFREFYLPTKDEREKHFTNRFEGYQIQSSKAVALLKSRGWKIDYEEPVRKISYRYNVMASVDFLFDLGTPAEIEDSTLEAIYFEERLTSKPLQISEVAPVHFSEILRDLDLVVSVAHVGEVDPEASHSTVEMRAVIAEEMIQLFQLTNAHVKLPHIVIDGQLGRYTIHLGSGNVHQLGGAMIPVLAIPSQHRGRVFLPFVDEDPKTAEISAKLLLFAEDDKINDPNIRAYIK